MNLVEHDARALWHAGAEMVSPQGRPVPRKGDAVVHAGRAAVVTDWDGKERLCLRPPRGGIEWDAAIADLAAA